MQIKTNLIPVSVTSSRHDGHVCTLVSNVSNVPLLFRQLKKCAELQSVCFIKAGFPTQITHCLSYVSLFRGWFSVQSFDLEQFFTVTLTWRQVAWLFQVSTRGCITDFKMCYSSNGRKFCGVQTDFRYTVVHNTTTARWWCNSMRSHNNHHILGPGNMRRIKHHNIFNWIHRCSDKIFTQWDVW